MPNYPMSIEMGVYPFVVPEVALDQTEEYVETAYGCVRVDIYGKGKHQHAILTIHDLAMNSMLNFENFFLLQAPSSQMSKRFCVFNINVPGQECDAGDLPANFIFPSMDGLARIVEDVVKHYRLKTFIGIGVGAGANVLLRYALNNAKMMDALVLVNPIAQRAGWIEWFYQKWNLSYLRLGQIKQFTVDYFLWHHFGKHIEECHPDIVQQYKNYFYTHQNAKNTAMFIESFLNRNELVLRDAKSTTDFLLTVPTLLIVGANSAFVNDSVYLNSQLNPKITEWLKVSDSSGLVLDDKPEHVLQAFLLFIQGIGFCADINVPQLIASLTTNEFDGATKSGRPGMLEYVNELK